MDSRLLGYGTGVTDDEEPNTRREEHHLIVVTLIRQDEGESLRDFMESAMQYEICLPVMNPLCCEDMIFEAMEESLEARIFFMGATSEAIAKIFQVPLEKPLRKNRRRHLRPHLAHLNQIPAGTPSKSIAIKKFKQSKDDDDVSPTPICKIMLLREITHENLVKLVNVHINHVDMSLYLAFDYAKHDLYFGISFHREAFFLFVECEINCVMSEGEEHGVVKMADFGLARIYQAPLKPLCDNGV
ncbi:hypothetical protein JHK82_055398 [Glycine max]|nr:hypothetical protein JHK82_055398 [Glycine max]